MVERVRVRGGETGLCPGPLRHAEAFGLGKRPEQWHRLQGPGREEHWPVRGRGTVLPVEDSVEEAGPRWEQPLGGLLFMTPLGRLVAVACACVPLCSCR